ncbi:MAG TPA: lysophospholipid acyltransferase family protein [Micropepsaceae bacterium]|nr:lysophospholipid acyltransferase family protein [Micropepsaceae bacterium]
MNQAVSPKILPTAPALPTGRRLRYWLEAAVFFLVMGFFRLFSIDRASAIGGWIGRNLVGRTYLSRRPLRNLRVAFPEKSEAELRIILTAMWDNLGRVMGEYPHLDRLHWTGANPRITMSGTEYLDEAKARGKGVMLVSGHFANWEIMPFVGREYGFSGGTLVRPPNNPYVSRWMEAVRARNGMQEQIPKGAHGMRRTFALLRKNEAICLLVDQRASEGIKVPFFGRDAFTTPAPAALALKLGAVVIPVSNERRNGAHFHMRAYPIIEPPNTGDAERDLVEFTARITRFIEDRVRENPGQWLWIHKRWVKENAPLRKRAQAQSQDGP